jgi:hypothetical protein
MPVFFFFTSRSDAGYLATQAEGSGPVLSLGLSAMNKARWNIARATGFS